MTEQRARVCDTDGASARAAAVENRLQNAMAAVLVDRGCSIACGPYWWCAAPKGHFLSFWQKFFSQGYIFLPKSN